MLLILIAAEPASIFYIVTGAIGVIFVRRRTARTANSSVAMLFCRRSSHERLRQLTLV